MPTAFSSRLVEGLALLAAFLLSALCWLVLSWLAREHEAWDSALYFLTSMPLSVAIGAVGGFAFGRGTWRWPLAFAAGQFAGLVALSNGDASLWPLTIAILLVLSLPCWGAAVIGALVRKRRAAVRP